LNRGATVNSWNDNNRDHVTCALNYMLPSNEVLEVDGKARVVTFRPLNAWEQDGAPKLLAGWEFPYLLPGPNEILVEHGKTYGVGNIYFGSNWYPRYWTP